MSKRESTCVRTILGEVTIYASRDQPRSLPEPRYRVGPDFDVVFETSDSVRLRAEHWQPGDQLRVLREDAVAVVAVVAAIVETEGGRRWRHAGAVNDAASVVEPDGDGVVRWSPSFVDVLTRDDEEIAVVARKSAGCITHVVRRRTAMVEPENASAPSPIAVTAEMTVAEYDVFSVWVYHRADGGAATWSEIDGFSVSLPSLRQPAPLPDDVSALPFCVPVMTCAEPAELRARDYQAGDVAVSWCRGEWKIVAVARDGDDRAHWALEDADGLRGSRIAFPVDAEPGPVLVAVMRPSMPNGATLESRGALVAFLYNLARDHLPVGVVEKIVVENEWLDRVEYSNEQLAEISRGWAERLSGRNRRA